MFGALLDRQPRAGIDPKRSLALDLLASANDTPSLVRIDSARVWGGHSLAQKQPSGVTNTWIRHLQIQPPKNWQDFEDLIHELFVAEWRDPNAQKNGRRGQPQHGVDVFGSRNGDYAHVDGVQCKGKDQKFGARATVKEFDVELAKAECFRPKLSSWTFATAAPTDGRLQAHARYVSAERANEGRFPVFVWAGKK